MFQPTRLFRAPTRLFTDSVIESQRDAGSPGLVGQISDPRPCSTLAVQREECPLIRQVVEEHSQLPTGSPHADAKIEQRVRGQQGIEGEDVLVEWTANRRAALVNLELRHVHGSKRTGAGVGGQAA